MVDGYNIIHAWPELNDLVDEHMDIARTKLQDILSNYQGFEDVRSSLYLMHTVSLGM